MPYGRLMSQGGCDEFVAVSSNTVSCSKCHAGQIGKEKENYSQASSEVKGQSSSAKNGKKPELLICGSGGERRRLGRVGSDRNDLAVMSGRIDSSGRAKALNSHSGVNNIDNNKKIRKIPRMPLTDGRTKSSCKSEDVEVFPYDENWEEMNDSHNASIGNSVISVDEKCIRNTFSRSSESEHDLKNGNNLLHGECSTDHAIISDDYKDKKNDNERKGGEKRKVNGYVNNDYNNNTNTLLLGKEQESQSDILSSTNDSVGKSENDTCLLQVSEKSDCQSNVAMNTVVCGQPESTTCDRDVHDVIDEEEMNDSTDFSRFKESTPCKLFPPKIWKSLENGDLDSFSKFVETKLDSFTNDNDNSRKRTLCSVSEKATEGDSEESFAPCKKRLRSDGNKCITLTNNSREDDVGSSDGAVSMSEKSPPKAKKQKVYAKIPDECYAALDCEMVGAGLKGSRSVLGRCSIVDYNGMVLYDRYVLPSEPITDFRTRWSGIKPKHMESAEPMEKAWQDIRQCLKNKVVVGHSVRNDFDVIQFFPHPFLVRDTARCQLLSRMAGLVTSGQGNSLKSLTKKIMDKDIQVGRDGHDSVEDARATLELFKVVREEWEKHLFDRWGQEGVDMDDLVASLKDGTEYHDSAGRKITGFGQGECVHYVPTCAGDVNGTTSTGLDDYRDGSDGRARVDWWDGSTGMGGTDGRRRSGGKIVGRNGYNNANRQRQQRGGRRHSHPWRQHADFLRDEFWPSS